MKHLPVMPSGWWVRPAHLMLGSLVVARIHDWADMGLDHASLGAGKFGLATRDNIPDPTFDSGTS